MSAVKNMSAMSYDNVVENIAKARKDFLEKDINPGTSHFVRPEVAESWMRSKALGIDPYALPDIEKVVHNYSKDARAFVDCASPVLRRLERIMHDTEYSIGLYDSDGLLLDLRGSEKTMADYAKLGLVPGTLSNEETVGTCAHGLCIRLKQPVVIRGPEHYNKHYLGTTCAAAPIFSKRAKLLGVLTIESVTTEQQFIKTLDWVEMAAWAVQNEMIHKDQLEKEITKNHHDSMLMQSMRMGLITIDSAGAISYINRLAASLLDVDSQSAIGRPFEDLLGGDFDVSRAVFAKNSTRYLRLPRTKGNDLMLSFNPRQSNLDDTETVVELWPVEETKETVNLFTNMDPQIRIERLVTKNLNVKRMLSAAISSPKSSGHVLVFGERGAGKSHIAAIFHHGTRPLKPLVKVNCKDYFGNEIETVLFGGQSSFSYDDENKVRLASGQLGKVQLAEGGSLLLQNIEYLPLGTQRKLMSTLHKMNREEESFPNVRIIATSASDLRFAVRNGAMLEELYDLISLLKITVPPLRQRPEDVPLLAEKILAHYADEADPPQLTTKAMDMLISYSWPENVDELASVLHAAFIRSKNGVIKASDLPIERMSDEGEKRIFDLAAPIPIAQYEKRAIERLLEETQDTQKIADVLGIGRTTLYRKIQKYGIQVHS